MPTQTANRQEETDLQPQRLEEQLIHIVHRLPPERVVQLIEFARFLELQTTEQTVKLSSLKKTARPRMTVRQFRESGLIGLWAGRDDIEDSSLYARQLREKVQRRGQIDYDFLGQ